MYICFPASRRPAQQANVQSHITHLTHKRNLLAIPGQIKILDVYVVQSDAPGLRVIEPLNE